ncbi:hypothetical protein O6H91_Y337900 [Diphasiastrum complanatum]|nr:hypothetical protein O6H91_Y337900 [Diphasiastrum complanatum]
MRGSLSLSLSLALACLWFFLCKNDQVFFNFFSGRICQSFLELRDFRL